MTDERYKVIVREPDGFERLVLVPVDQVITESEVLWDERIERAPPTKELLDKANLEDAKRNQERDAEKLLQKNRRDAALQALLTSEDKNTVNLLILLGYT